MTLICMKMKLHEFCIQFHFHANQSHFHKNGFALRLALKQRHKRTWKWPIYLLWYNRVIWICIVSKWLSNLAENSKQNTFGFHGFNHLAKRCVWVWTVTVHNYEGMVPISFIIILFYYSKSKFSFFNFSSSQSHENSSLWNFNPQGNSKPYPVPKFPNSPTTILRQQGTFKYSTQSKIKANTNRILC